MSDNQNDNGLRPSRYYQNWLQIIARVSTAFLFVGGYFLSKDNLAASILFLVCNLISGYMCSRLKYRRSQAVTSEYRQKVPKQLRPSGHYQKWLQFSGRGREVFVFLLGVILGKGCWLFSFILLLALTVFSVTTSELAYRREQAVLPEQLTTGTGSYERNEYAMDSN